jgi:hypothetical protein
MLNQTATREQASLARRRSALHALFPQAARPAIFLIRVALLALGGAPRTGG